MGSTLVRFSGILVGGAALGVLGGMFVAGDLRVAPMRWPSTVVAPVEASQPRPPVPVTGRGRLKPAGGIIRIAGPSRPGAVIDRLYVREGDRVQAGQVVAVLDGTGSMRATVQRLTAEASQAEVDSSRFRRLFRDGIVSALERDTVELRAAVTRAELAGARAQLDASNVRSSIAGRVLDIHAHAGERIGPEGVLDVGDTAHMEVVAEIYETDVVRVYPGQAAAISAPALGAPLSGSVRHVGLTIGKQNVFGVDPTSDTDARVVEVHIRLDEAGPASGLTNLQVDVDLAA